MFGGLHIELAAIGNWLEDSGWSNAIVQSGVASPGTADSFITASHITRTRHAHQVTASALYILLKRAYVHYTASLDEGIDPLEFETWRKQREESVPQFQYWSITLDFELAVLIFVRSLRERNFQLYIDSLTVLVPWFFALNHTNYARWLPVHIRDMMTLAQIHPAVAREFEAGKFVVRKTCHSFSSLPIDQAHEQNNKRVNGDGGAVGLTQSTSQLLRWMVAGPEVARAIGEFELSQELLQHTRTKLLDGLHPNFR